MKHLFKRIGAIFLTSVMICSIAINDPLTVKAGAFDKYDDISGDATSSNISTTTYTDHTHNSLTAWRWASVYDYNIDIDLSLYESIAVQIALPSSSTRQQEATLRFKDANGNTLVATNGTTVMQTAGTFIFDVSSITSIGSISGTYTGDSYYCQKIECSGGTAASASIKVLALVYQNPNFTSNLPYLIFSTHIRF